ncbi:hypothetical protein WMY93_009281 [Mugilogobius chulae]|uniref:Caspase-3 n=1 Tax=Mugilogobius chulae TaxID=88201 RepID=A0AAW0PPW7_9GOBI
MEDAIKEVSEKDHSENASFICVILSHGDENKIYGIDDYTDLHKLTGFLKGTKCKSLIGKPKLFFIQACRGQKFDDGVPLRDCVDADPTPSPPKLPVEADFLYAYGTAKGYYAWRNEEKGSWFIQTLCEKLLELRNQELMHILTSVNRKVAYEFESSQGQHKEIPCVTSLLTKLFYFPKTLPQQRIMADEKQLKNDQPSSLDSVDVAQITMEDRSVKASSTVPGTEDDCVYKMDYGNVGRCVIINNKTFTSGLETRLGTDVDQAALQKTFEDLGYKVDVHNDLTKNQMKSVLKEVSEEDHSQNSSFVCVILSHGTDDKIHGTDKSVKLDSLTEYFKGKECLSLFGKPKLFFLQACRGKKFDEGLDRDVLEASPLPTRKKLPVEADFLYAYATAPGHVAWRNHEKGSWFIQSLCEILPKHKHRELMHILIRVNRKVAFDYESSKTKQKEIPCITCMLTKEFYFPK